MFLEAMTITEALSEVKLIQKKIEKKRQFVLTNLTRFEHLKDPLETGGGSTKVLHAELQSIEDLQTRLETIRWAIADANSKTTLTLDGKTKSLTAWLSWKRDLADTDIAFRNSIHTSLKQSFDRAATQPQVYKTEETQTPQLAKLILNLDYGEMVKRAERTSELLEKLDGKLSLLNATIVIGEQKTLAA